MQRERKLRKVLAILGAVVLSFETAAPSGAYAVTLCPPGTMAWTETQLFMGRNIAGEEGVSQEDWRAFTIAEIIPRFNNGFTVVDGAGYWRGESCKTVALHGGCEKTKVLLIQYAPSPEAEASVNAIANAYIELFSQSSVMRSDQSVCTQFYNAKK